MNKGPRRRGFVAGDLLLFLAALSVLLALARPTLARRRILRAADAACADVEAVRAAAERLRAESGAWPRTVAAHELPPLLASALPDSTGPSPRPYRLGWRLWEILDEGGERMPARVRLTADSLPAPDSTVHRPPIVSELAGIEVRSADARVLGELLARYASERVYVRDSTWTLVLGVAGGGP